MTQRSLQPAETRAPTVSVVMPVYKRPYTLADTVRSILDQSFPDFELIVVLDGPDLELNTILSRIDDSRLRVVISPENVGIPKALNLGLAHARGKYFARMDNGDLAEPNRLQSQLDSLVRSGASVSFCHTRIIEEDGALLEQTYQQPWILRLWMSMFCQSLGTGGSALFVNRDLLNSVGGFDETFSYAQDYEISERLASLGQEFAYTDDVSLVIPYYGDGITKSKRSAQEEFTRIVMERATRKYLPEITAEQLRGLSVWRNRYRLKEETDPMPGIRVLKELGRAFATAQGLERLPFSICNDISQYTELHLKSLSGTDRRFALRLIAWCAAEARSLRLWKYYAGCIKRLLLRSPV